MDDWHVCLFHARLFEYRVVPFFKWMNNFIKVRYILELKFKQINVPMPVREVERALSKQDHSSVNQQYRLAPSHARKLCKTRSVQRFFLQLAANPHTIDPADRTRPSRRVVCSRFRSEEPIGPTAETCSH